MLVQGYTCWFYHLHIHQPHTNCGFLMTNNDILRRLRYALNLNNTALVDIFAAAKLRKIGRGELTPWLKKDDEEGYKSLSDENFAIFLNGLINVKRGAKPGPALPAETELNNNIIFRKLKIALNLQSHDIIEILDLADFRFSEHELSALFRKPEHKHFRPCKDQVLRNFLMGLQLKLRAK